MSHPDRLARTRQAFLEHTEVDMAYSTFLVVDEHGEQVPLDRLTPSVAEILESHRRPVQGEDAWIRIGTEVGYTSLTSTVAVRTSLVTRYPFPVGRGSEDAHTWLRMSAGGGALAYLPDIPSRYRIPQHKAGSSDRSRPGSRYYQRKAEVDTDGFLRAVAIALGRGRIDAA